MKLLHLARSQPNPRLFTPRFCRELSALGEFKLVEEGDLMSEAARDALIQSYEVLLTGWESISVPAAIAQRPGSLQYICHLTGEYRWYRTRGLCPCGSERYELG